MKIALFVAQLKGGGAERMMVNLANGLAELKHEVLLICAKFEGPYCEEVGKKVVVIDLGKERVSKCVFQLYNVLKQERPSVLVTTQAHAIMGAAIACKCFFYKTPLFIREATTPSEVWKRKKRSFSSQIRKSLLIKLYKKANGYIAVSEGVKDDLNSFFGIERDKINVINNPVITPEIDALKERDVSHSFLSANRDFLTIISVGRIHPAKDFVTLIKALGIVRKTVNAKLLILGNKDSDKQEFKKLNDEIALLGLGEYIDFPGFDPNPYAYLAKADVFVLSSLYEGMPGVVVQALYCGCQIVSTNCKSGPEEILMNGVFGKLVKIGDSADMAKEIIDVNMHPFAVDVLQKRALDFNYVESAKQYLALFTSNES